MGSIGDQIAALRGDDFPAAVLALISLVTVLVGTWALLVAALASIPALRGLAVAFTPRILRGVLFAGVAGALGVPAAQADDRGVDGLRLPDRPAGRRRHRAGGAAVHGGRSERRHAVGDRP